MIKKITFKISLILVFIFAILQIQAQNKQLNNNQNLFEYNVLNKAFAEESGYIRCATVEYNEALRQKYPEIGTPEQFESWMAEKIVALRAQRLTNPSGTTEIITIPVVIHIIHNGEAIGLAPNINDAQAISQITVMNEDYRKMIGSRGYNEHADGADVEIEFCLAQKDPEGNPTNGIDRQNLGQDSWSTSGINATVKPQTIWDPTKYLNMWTVNFSDSTLLGYAQFPNNSGLDGIDAYNGGADTDGVVSNYNAFGSMDHDTNGDFIMNPTYQYGRTMTHEVGHWLGLRHTWGDVWSSGPPPDPDDESCNVDDFCVDTPNSGRPQFGCPTGADTCPDEGVDMIENYMDYTDDPCMNIFTQDQKDRILIVMQNSPRRVELLTSDVCSGFSLGLNVDPTGVCAPNNAVVSFEYSAQGGFSEIVSFSATGNPSGTSVSFSPTSASTSTTVVMTISGVTTAMVGNSTITISGIGGGITNSVDATLSVFTTSAGSTILQTPTDGLTDAPLAPELTWSAAADVLNYVVQIATDTNFLTIVENAISNTNSHTVVNTLNTNTTYYWRVKATNPCGDGAFSSAFSFSTADPEYCTSTYTNAGSEYIVNVTFNTIDNSSGDAPTDGYEDFTNITTDVDVSDTYDLSVSINTAGPYTDYCFAFIDWNKDYIFDVETEKYAMGFVTDVTSGVLTQSIDIPTNALSGTTRMRIIIEAYLDGGLYGEGPCDDDQLSEWGETEDYALNVIGSTVGVDDYTFDAFTVYPNPSDGLFNLSLQSNNNESLNVQLIDMRGRLIRNTNLNVNANTINTTLDYTAIEVGVYLLKLTKGDQIGVQQIIIK